MYQGYYRSSDRSFCGMRLENSTLLAQRNVFKAHAAKRTKRKGTLSLGPSDFPALLEQAGLTKTRTLQAANSNSS
jgi:hypothetical protein